jgi:hypothetical protein
MGSPVDYLDCSHVGLGCVCDIISLSKQVVISKLVLSFLPRILPPPFLAIKKLFDDGEATCSSRNIIQASDLKNQLEDLELIGTHVSILSLEIVKFYPSTRFDVVRRTVECHAAGLPADFELASLA